MTYGVHCPKCGAELEVPDEEYITCECGNMYKMKVELLVVDPEEIE